MEVGIITFHWATNYGAVLQTYALQEAVLKLGYNVEIINYKPKRFDFGICQFLRNRKFVHPFKYYSEYNKEQKIERFRKKYLKLSRRFNSLEELKCEKLKYKFLITGSDQVWNTYFLQHGESNGSTAYFLDFGEEISKKIAYAVSFGTHMYPRNLIEKVRPLIRNLVAVSTRETTGQDILNIIGINSELVPDPTLLFNMSFFDTLLSGIKTECYKTRAYFLRDISPEIDDYIDKNNIEVIANCSVEEWINKIRNSSRLLTNSFHGVVFCLLYHIDFYVVLPTIDKLNMNDRFFTLLSQLEIANRIKSIYDIHSVGSESAIEWDNIDDKLSRYREVGWNFLINAFNQK